MRNKCNIRFLHRTVKDFIESWQIWDEIVKTSPDFDPYLHLCKAMVLQVKTWDTTMLPERHLRAFVKMGLVYASESTKRSHKTLIPLLDCLESCVYIMSTKLKVTWNHLEPRPLPGHRILLPWAIELDLSFWVQHLLDKGQPIESRAGLKSYLSFAIDQATIRDGDENNDYLRTHIPPRSHILSYLTPIRKRCLKLLLERGISPYRRQDDEPFWKTLCFRIAQSCSDSNGEYYKLDYLLDVADIIKNYGADISLLGRVISWSEVCRLRHMKDSTKLRLCELLSVQSVDQYQPSHSHRLYRLARIRNNRRRFKDRRKMQSRGGHAV